MNAIGMIEWSPKGAVATDKKVIVVTAICRYCQKIATRVVDCPEHLQDAPPGYIVFVDNDGRLQARREL